MHILIPGGARRGLRGVFSVTVSPRRSFICLTWAWPRRTAGTRTCMGACLPAAGRGRGPVDGLRTLTGLGGALRVNPSLDARWAMQVIDRLLDERPRPGQPPLARTPSGQAAVAPPGLVPGSPGQQAILASVVRALLAGEAG